MENERMSRVLKLAGAAAAARPGPCHGQQPEQPKQQLWPIMATAFVAIAGDVYEMTTHSK